MSLFDAVKREIEMNTQPTETKSAGFIDILNIELSEFNIKAEYRNNDIWVVGDVCFDGNAHILKNYIYDGNMKICNFSEDELNWLPKQISPNSTILFFDCSVSDSFINSLREKYGNDDIINVNDSNFRDYIKKYPSLVLGIVCDLSNKKNEDYNISLCYYFINKNNIKKRKTLNKNKETNCFDLSESLIINKNFTRCYINIDCLTDLKIDKYSDIYKVLNEYGNILCINKSNKNIYIGDVEISDNFISGLPKAMGANKYIVFNRCSGNTALIDNYKTTHTSRQYIGTDKYFNVMIM